MELLEELKEFEKRLEQEAIQKQEECKILDISCYNIPFDAIEGEEGPLFLVEKEVDGEIKRELQIGDKVIADIDEGNHVQMREGFLNEKAIILIKLRDVMPTSLRELEQIEMSKERTGVRSNKEQEKTSLSKEDKEKKELEEEGEIPKKRENANDIEIDLDKKITETKTFADLVPEVKEKRVTSVKVRRLDATRFEFYGETESGEEVVLESLETVEGTNPTKEITEVGANGEVREDDESAMFQIIHGTNEQNGNEGISIDMEAGIPEVSYFRRSRDNEYTSVPVNLKNTNQKRTDKEVQEYAEKTRNPEVSDNTKKAEKILETQEETTLENIDDDEHNDNRDTTLEYEEALIREAAERCKMSEEEFKKVLEQERKEGEPIEQSIERAEDEVNAQFISPMSR